MIASTAAAPRVGFEKAMRPVYEALTNGEVTAAPFKTMKDLFLFAACRGYQLTERRPLQAKETPIHWEVFSEQVDLPILKALAISATGAIAVLARPDEIATIAEEYANAGIRDLQYLLLDQPGQPLWNLVDLVRDETELGAI
jgi:dnd system-associated protein 4